MRGDYYRSLIGDTSPIDRLWTHPENEFDRKFSKARAPRKLYEQMLLDHFAGDRYPPVVLERATARMHLLTDQQVYKLCDRLGLNFNDWARDHTALGKLLKMSQGK